MKTKKNKRSKYWNELVEVLEREFPKKQCKERGHALVLLAYAEMALQKSEKETQKSQEKSFYKLLKAFDLRVEDLPAFPPNDKLIEITLAVGIEKVRQKAREELLGDIDRIYKKEKGIHNWLDLRDKLRSKSK